jgi:hypothetical protein
VWDACKEEWFQLRIAIFSLNGLHTMFAEFDVTVKADLDGTHTLLGLQRGWSKIIHWCACCEGTRTDRCKTSKDRIPQEVAHTALQIAETTVKTRQRQMKTVLVPL